MEGIPFQYTLVDSDDTYGDLLSRYFLSGFRKGYIRAGPDRVILPLYYLKFAKALDELEIRDDDTMVVSHPKTGTTWTQEMVWCIANDLDFEKAKVFLPERFPFLEFSTLFDYEDLLVRRPELHLPDYLTDSVTYVSGLQPPRFIKTHLPWQLLPQQVTEGTRHPKLVYVARNAKDTCVSYYHHSKLMEGYKGNFEDFCKLFIGDSLTFTPFWSHVLSFWERRHQPNILFLKYEDMKKDLPSVIRRTAAFLGKSLTEDQVSTLADHLSFHNMRNNRAVNYEVAIEINKTLKLIENEGHFMRSGQVGDWKNIMSPEVIANFDQWSQQHLQGTGLTL